MSVSKDPSDERNVRRHFSHPEPGYGMPFGGIRPDQPRAGIGNPPREFSHTEPKLKAIPDPL